MLKFGQLAIESGDWGKAYGIASLLARETLPSELADAVRIMSDILDPSNTSSDTAQKIVQFLPGRLLRVYDDEHGWHEDALRELVSDIVRQELEGSLGERITHNVRKLVRRELQRALAAEELEGHFFEVACERGREPARAGRLDRAAIARRAGELLRSIGATFLTISQPR